MAVALVLGGGAPNLPLMSGALLALDDAGVKFDLVSATGAGMLIGLMYASPKNGNRKATLQATREMGVHDSIYNVFPVNYKIFHKSGPMAEAYTKFHQTWLATMPRKTEAQRFMSDVAQFWMASFCPSDMTHGQNGLCQPPPWIDLVVDFDKLKDFDGEFFMSAYCIEDEGEANFLKTEITAEHFKAALAMPLIYSPYKMNGKTYLEGSAFDTLYFGPGGIMKKNLIDTVIYFDVLGQKKLVAEPDNLYDAWVQSIINPLTSIARKDSENYDREKPKGVELLRMPFKDHIPDEQWPKVLDWSYSNMSTLFDIGYETGEAFAKEHKKQILKSNEVSPKRVMETLGEAGYDKPVLDIVKKAERKAAPAKSTELHNEFKKLAKDESAAVMSALKRASEMFEQPPEDAPAKIRNTAGS